MTIRVLITLLAATSAVQAQTALRATDNVNVRTGPGTGYAAIGQVPAGHTYVGVSTSGAWWRIYFDGRLGWTHGDYYGKPPGQSGVKVGTDVLNVRTGPGTGYGIKGTVLRGQIHWWPTTSAGWYQIHYGGGTGWVSGAYVTRVALSGAAPPPPSGNPTNLNMTHYYQQLNYTCGPTSAQMIIQYVSGRYVAQSTIAAFAGTSSSTGTSNYNVVRSINNYAGTAYVQSGYDQERLRRNINMNKPCNINMKGRYLAYWNYANIMHHSPAKGYTSGGFYIHDSSKGPNKWASNVELSNAVRYHHNLTGVRY